ncbi:hypothetical protein HanIR_Chr06g0287761 [Helianthus annuus]|nr:hypothetical protein HanIR_Chr06g0287761 [Helianthus annuus]
MSNKHQFTLDLANGSGRVGSDHGSRRVRVKTGSGRNGSIKIRVVLVRVKTGSGQNGFGLKGVRVRTGFGLGRVGSVWLKIKKKKKNREIVHQVDPSSPLHNIIFASLMKFPL